MGLRRDGVISEEVFEGLVAEVDEMLTDTSSPFWFVTQDSLPDRLRSRMQGNAEVEEITVEVNSDCEGRAVQDIPWPPNLVVASIQRGKESTIPRGSTKLAAGDILTIIADAPAILSARELCQARKDTKPGDQPG